MAYDYALVLDDDVIVAHKLDCPQARRAAETGKPVLTMFDCTKPLGSAYKKHHCLGERDDFPPPRYGRGNESETDESETEGE